MYFWIIEPLGWNDAAVPTEPRWILHKLNVPIPAVSISVFVVPTPTASTSTNSSLISNISPRTTDEIPEIAINVEVLPRPRTPPAERVVLFSRVLVIGAQVSGFWTRPSIAIRDLDNLPVVSNSWRLPAPTDPKVVPIPAMAAAVVRPILNWSSLSLIA